MIFKNQRGCDAISEASLDRKYRVAPFIRASSHSGGGSRDGSMLFSKSGGVDFREEGFGYGYARANSGRWHFGVSGRGGSCSRGPLGYTLRMYWAKEEFEREIAGKFGWGAVHQTFAEQCLDLINGT